MTFDEAITLLFRAPHAEFVTERKRLAAEVKAGGDKEGAGKLAKLARPPVSAWAVNQLWREDRADFDELIATARKVREGDFKATAAHKAVLAKLRARAAAVLTAMGNAAAEATLRKVETSLSAIAVNGGFEPDLPGALTDDRDPPGFASMGIMAAAPGAPLAVGPSAAAGEDAVRAQVAAATQALAEAAGRAQAEIDAHTRTSALARAAAEKKQAQVLADAARLQGRDVPAANTDSTTRDAAKNDSAKNDAAKNDSAKNDAAKSDATKSDATKSDAAKNDAAKNDAAKSDATKSDAAKNDAAKNDAAKNDAAKNDSANADANTNAGESADDESDATDDETSDDDTSEDEATDDEIDETSDNSASAGEDKAAATPSELVRQLVHQMKDAGKTLSETFSALEGNAAGWIAVMKAIVEVFAISLVEAREAFEKQYASVTAFENPEPKHLAPPPRAKPAVALVPPPVPSAPLPPPVKPSVPGEKTTDAEKTFVKRQVAQWAERVSKLSADLETAKASLAAAQQKLDGME